jgi:hypothetical protein
MKKCGARTKHDGTPCERSPIRGRTRCRLHGGKTLVGTACAHYRSGRYSEYVPEQLRAHYERAEADAELLSLRGEVALTDARLTELLSRVQTGESGALWADLKKAYREFQAAKHGKDVTRMQIALMRVEYLIDGAVQDHDAWTEIGDLIEQRRKLTESEFKRMVALGEMMTKAEALALVHRLIDILTVHIPDKKILSAIIVDMQQFTGPPQALPVYTEDTDD